MPSYVRRVSVLLFCLLMQIGLGTNQAWSVFVKPLHDAYGYSAADLQKVFALSTFVFCATLIIWGRLHDRYGPRVLGVCSAILLAVGYLLTWKLGQHYGVLLVSVGVITSLGITAGYVCPLATAMKWFPTHKGLVAGLAMAGFAGGPTILSNVVQWLLHSGWPVLEIFHLMLCVYPPLVLVCALNLITPEGSHAVTRPKVEYRAIFSDIRFWTLFVAMLVGSFCFLIVMGSAKPLATFFGLPELAAVQAISVLAASNALARVFWGGLLDRLGTKRSIFLAQLCAVAGLTLLLTAGSVGPVFFVAVAGVAFCYASSFAVFPATVARLYGLSVLGSIYPFIMMAQGISSIAPIINGTLVDRTHSYIPGLVLALAVTVVGAIACTLMARRAGDRL